MDLRAWKETERFKPVAFHAGGSNVSHQYQDTSEYETEEGSPARGSGLVMPSPHPEDDWVEELPRPMMLNPPSLLSSRRQSTGATSTTAKAAADGDGHNDDDAIS